MRLSTPTGLAVVAFAAAVCFPIPQTGAQTNSVTEGSLIRLDPNGKPTGACPLKHTDVKADVTGFIARVKVTQTFYNPLAEKIEAVYVFPLPHKSAVDDMTMVVGDRRVVEHQLEHRAVAGVN